MYMMMSSTWYVGDTLCRRPKVISVKRWRHTCHLMLRHRHFVLKIAHVCIWCNAILCCERVNIPRLQTVRRFRRQPCPWRKMKPSLSITIDTRLIRVNFIWQMCHWSQISHMSWHVSRGCTYRNLIKPWNKTQLILTVKLMLSSFNCLCGNVSHWVDSLTI
jgi:hypothetical protein